MFENEQQLSNSSMILYGPHNLKIKSKLLNVIEKIIHNYACLLLQLASLLCSLGKLLLVLVPRCLPAEPQGWALPSTTIAY